MDTTVAATPHLRTAGLVITAGSLIAIALATLSPQPKGAVESHLCLICGSFGTVDAILNVILFIPLGVGLGLFGARPSRAIVAMCALSASIETAQFFLIPGRDSTLGDVLTNTLGGALGFAISGYFDHWLHPTPRFSKRLVVFTALLWLTAQAVASFGFAPSLPRSQYYGQIARVLGNFAIFSGRVLDSRVGDARFVDTRFGDSDSVRRQLLAGAPVTATVVAGTQSKGIAPILRVVDSRQREIVLLAREASTLVFGIRSGAAVLRLRQPLFGLVGAFRDWTPGNALPADTVALAARYVRTGVWLRAESSHARSGGQIRVSASRGWVLLMPFAWSIDGTLGEAFLGAIWIAWLLLPMAYWAIFAAAPHRRSVPRTYAGAMILLATLLLSLGLVVVPLVFGIRSAPPQDWIASFVAISLGAIVGFRTCKQKVRVSGPR